MDFPEHPADLYEYESIARAAGFHFPAGVDEAGRGPLAGPVTAGAVILPPGRRYDKLNDSKQLSEARRDVLFDLLTNDPEVVWAVVSVDAARIDEINILQATHEAMRLVVRNLSTAPNLVLVDGNPVTGFSCPAVNIIQGDAKCAAISAASIVAKVHRDRHMMELDKRFPGYGFSEHKGYGTASHLSALRKLGPSPVHRKSFSPVARIIHGGRQGELDLFA